MKFEKAPRHEYQGAGAQAEDHSRRKAGPVGKELAGSAGHRQLTSWKDTARDGHVGQGGGLGYGNEPTGSGSDAAGHKQKRHKY